MSSPNTNPRDAERIAYEKGRNVGLAIGALAVSVIAYINLLGIEKSLLAIVLAILALQNARSLSTPRFRAQLALVLASIHAVTVIVIVIVFREKLAELARRVIELLHSLS
jgi:predicted branched-subunit amino acid permease